MNSTLSIIAALTLTATAVALMHSDSIVREWWRQWASLRLWIIERKLRIAKRKNRPADPFEPVSGDIDTAIDNIDSLMNERLTAHAVVTELGLPLINLPIIAVALAAQAVLLYLGNGWLFGVALAGAWNLSRELALTNPLAWTTRNYFNVLLPPLAAFLLALAIELK